MTKCKMIYFALSLIVVLAFCIIPYSKLHANGLELIVFWSITTLMWIIITNVLLLSGRL